ncbi:hypothetical protein BV20DRAFT_959073 [Pilatotrama ljubarskyi]|nr:hypothetical protein BV20DRAFT_959073 [Pilatotrama ljubarskyi]
MQDPRFRTEDLAGFDAAREGRRLDTYCEYEEGSALSSRDVWVKTSVKLRVPKEGVRYASEHEAPEFVVDGIYYRSFTEILRTMYTQSRVKDWHVVPHKLYCLHVDDGSETDTASTRSREDSDASSSDHSDGSRRNHAPVAHQDEDEDGIRIRSELYHSDAVWEEDLRMRARPREAGDSDDLEYIIAPLIIYSDSTHLTNFGWASLWPVYLYNGSESKYTRGRPSAYSAQHAAYIPSLPNTIQDFYVRLHGIAATAAVLTFLKRELMQQIWLLLLDEPFMYAYVHGLIILCGDSIRRRTFPRFFIHAADYVEKVLQACLKFLAKCPCPRCRINKDKIIEMGTLNDRSRRSQVRMDNDDIHWRISLARQWIFEDGTPLTSVYITRLLGPLSLTPTRNAFSVRLREHGFNFYSLYAPDLLHEFELGTWKDTFNHYLRVLYAAGGDNIQEFNRRFRQIPTFGRSTIRRFCTNVSEQSKLAARDYEGRLKCHIPAIEGLLPERDDLIILDLSFDCAMWHALAKLRMHTPRTIDALDETTVQLGRSVRRFAKTTCKDYVTVELPREAARSRRKARKTADSDINAGGAKRKVFNYKTYKFHSLWDYPSCIRTFTSMDNATTQDGELEHRHVKRFYARTNKNEYAYQIALHTHRAAKLRVIKERVDVAASTASPDDSAQTDGFPNAVRSPQDDSGTEPLPYSSPLDHHHIADSQRDHEDLIAWTRSHQGDPALEGFILSLKEHLLERLRGREDRDHLDSRTPESSVPYSASDRAQVLIRNNQIYWHSVLRVNYTTYDLRRSQDSINPRTHADILLLSPAADSEGDIPGAKGDSTSDSCSEAHPFWYARVVKIFHVNARLASDAGGSFERVDVLWVRWLRLDETAPWGFGAKRLPRLHFIPHADVERSFAFVNPSDVLRGVHLIPAFAFRRTDKLLGPSLARAVRDEPSAEDTDFCYYYVNMFVDRDMFMRFFGGGVGHQGGTGRVQTAFDAEDFEWVDLDEDDEDIIGNAPVDEWEVDELSNGELREEQDVVACGEDEELLYNGAAPDEEEARGDSSSEDDDSGEELDCGSGEGDDNGEEDEYGAEGFAAW